MSFSSEVCDLEAKKIQISDFKCSVSELKIQNILSIGMRAVNWSLGSLYLATTRPGALHFKRKTVHLNFQMLHSGFG